LSEEESLTQSIPVITSQPPFNSILDETTVETKQGGESTKSSSLSKGMLPTSFVDRLLPIHLGEIKMIQLDKMIPLGALKGDLARTAAWAFKGAEADPLALQLLRGVCVFSRDWKADLWLTLKNKQIFLSMFLCHPKHPFSRTERRFAFAVSCILAWGLECWFCAFRYESCYDHPEYNFIELFIYILLFKIAISATVNGLYDATLEFAMTCACVQTGVPLQLKVCCEALSYFQLLIQFGGGCFLLLTGIYYLIFVTHDGLLNGFFWADIVTSIKELFIGKVPFTGVERERIRSNNYDLMLRSLLHYLIFE